MSIPFTDSVTISGTRKTEDGYLIATAKSVRTGIQLYRGDEMDHPEMDVVRVYRPPEEVFSKDSLQGFSHAPMTMGHPEDGVNAANWKDLAVGEVSTAAVRDGEWVALPLILKDAAAIQAVEGGKAELSAGYRCDIDWTAGVTDDGQAYDAVQRNIRINHLAVVDRARAGSEARIGDDAKSWGASPVTTDQRKEKAMPDIRKVTVDGVTIETTDQGAQVIEKLQQKLTDANTAAGKAEAEHQKAIAAKDAELGKKDAEIETLKKSQMDESKLDQMVADRADIVSKAKAIAPELKTDGVSNVDIRRQAVIARLGDEKVKDKSDDYVGALFDHLSTDAAGDEGASTAEFGAHLKDAKRTTDDPWGKAVFDAAGVTMKKQ